MLPLSNRALNDRRMERIRNKRDDQIVLCDLSVEGLLVPDIEGYWAGELDTFCLFLSAFECSAGCGRSANDTKRGRMTATHQQRPQCQRRSKYLKWAW
jgi:hypothetical protein